MPGNTVPQALAQRAFRAWPPTSRRSAFAGLVLMRVDHGTHPLRLRVFFELSSKHSGPSPRSVRRSHMCRACDFTPAMLFVHFSKTHRRISHGLLAVCGLRRPLVTADNAPRLTKPGKSSARPARAVSSAGSPNAFPCNVIALAQSAPLPLRIACMMTVAEAMRDPVLREGDVAAVQARQWIRRSCNGLPRQTASSKVTRSSIPISLPELEHTGCGDAEALTSASPGAPPVEPVGLVPQAPAASAPIFVLADGS